MVRKSLLVAALVASMTTAHVHADTAMSQVTAVWSGSVAFGDGCDPRVCGSADTIGSGNYCASSTALANAAVTLTGCRAQMSFSYVKNAGLCVGADFADLYFTDFAGQRMPPIGVAFVASDGAITFQGRFVNVGGSGAYSVAGTMAPACGQPGRWSGTLTYTD